MTTSPIETAPQATDVSLNANELIAYLVDGRTIVVPLNWYPRLLNATPEQRAEYRLFGNGEYINWPQNEDLNCCRSSSRHACAPKRAAWQL